MRVAGSANRPIGRRDSRLLPPGGSGRIVGSAGPGHRPGGPVPRGIHGRLRSRHRRPLGAPNVPRVCDPRPSTPRVRSPPHARCRAVRAPGPGRRRRARGSGDAHARADVGAGRHARRGAPLPGLEPERLAAGGRGRALRARHGWELPADPRGAGGRRAGVQGHPRELGHGGARCRRPRRSEPHRPGPGRHERRVQRGALGRHRGPRAAERGRRCTQERSSGCRPS